MLQSGYSADRIMPIILDFVNGLVSGSSRLRRPADPKFARLVRLVSEGQLAGTIEARIERPKEGLESSVIVFPPRNDPSAIARRQEITSLLGLKPDLTQFKVYYGAHSGKADEIDMKTRSMLEIMLEFAATVQVPEADVAEGKAGPGAVSSRPAEALGGPPMRILVGDLAPKDPSVAVQYNNRWFWIADTDIQSKTTFGIVMLLFSISETGIKGGAPVVTIPANQ